MDRPPDHVYAAHDPVMAGMGGPGVIGALQDDELDGGDDGQKRQTHEDYGPEGKSVHSPSLPLEPAGRTT